MQTRNNDQFFFFFFIFIWQLQRQTAKLPNLIPHQTFRLYSSINVGYTAYNIIQQNDHGTPYPIDATLDYNTVRLTFWLLFALIVGWYGTTDSNTPKLIHSKQCCVEEFTTYLQNKLLLLSIMHLSLTPVACLAWCSGCLSTPWPERPCQKLLAVQHWICLS